MPHKSIQLRKVTAGAANTLPVGWPYEWTYTNASVEMARQRAKVALKRDHPTEDLSCWEENA